METSQPHIANTGTGKVTKKKTGRKPNPNAVSPTLRKAQNRAAQQAFRERKQQYIKDIELDHQRLLNERDKHHKKIKQLGKENDILKCENWYLKGIVLSLQLVCFKSKLCIPKHTPHIDDRALQVMAESAPASIATYIDVNCHYPSPISNDDISDYSIQSSIPNDDGDDDRSPPAPAPTSPSSDQQHSAIQFHHFHHNSADDATITHTTTNDSIKLQPVLLRHDTVTNNLAAIQSLRIRLRLQSALFRENSVLHAITPTPLQLSVPHDPRIDLIPTPHMRDRMIIFQDQFDLDDCLRLLVNEAYFHGGDPTAAGNWELPASFFEKYWFLTIDYTQERISKRWKQLRAKTTADIRATTSSSAAALDPAQQPSGCGQQQHDHAQHHQPTPPPPSASATLRIDPPALISPHPEANYINNSCVPHPPPTSIDPLEFMLLQDNDLLYQQQQPLDSIQQAPDIQPQPPWTQPFPFNDL